MRALFRCTLTLSLVLVAIPARAQQSPVDQLRNASPRQLERLLIQFPSADTNKDGVLTQKEAIAFAERFFGQAAKNDPKKVVVPQPTHENVSYGPHERNVLDYWSVDSLGKEPPHAPAPLVIFIHGGGFIGGDKMKWREDANLRKLLDSGFAVAAINYRFRQHAPIQDILHDAARAVQFIRSKADSWGFDKTRVASWGGSAGAGTSLWLGSRDDLANPSSDDPIARESSRVQAVVLNATQATYDLTRWESFLGPANENWWSTPHEPAQFYHLASIEELKSPAAAAILRECDMLNWIGPGDAPVFVNNPLEDVPPKDHGHYLHHPAHAREIQKACNASGVPCFWVQEPRQPEFASAIDFVTNALQAKAN